MTVLLQQLESTWFGATLSQWGLALTVFIGGYFVLALVRRVVAGRLVALAARTATQIDDFLAEILRRTRWYFLMVISLQAATRVIPPEPKVAAVINSASVLVILIQLGVWGNGLIGVAADRYVKERGTTEAGARATIQAMGYAGRFVLWALLVVTALDHFGIEVTALITGLGIGGVAIALAVQNILGDLFAALAIVLDKPFVVGDFIIVDNVLGTVEHVGLKTTRIRSLGGEQIIISNNDLLKSRIRNYKRMEQRRIVFNIDVTYHTPPETLLRIPGMIREIIEKVERTRFDRSHFLNFMDSSLRVETVYWVLSSDFNVYADIQHKINVEIVRRFNAEGIDFAFPSRTLYIKGGGGEQPAAIATSPATSPYADE